MKKQIPLFFITIFVLTFLLAFVYNISLQAHDTGCPPSGTDIDGDCYGNTTDNCPSVHGHFGGCPKDPPPETEANGTSGNICGSGGDRDGDTTCDSQDRCPDSPGYAQYQGCSEGEEVAATSTSEIVVTNPPPVTPDPNASGCYWSRNSNYRVYLRSTPSSESTANRGELLPIDADAKLQVLGTVINSFGQVWYRIADENGAFLGYVSGEYSQSGGLDCGFDHYDLILTLQTAACMPSNPALLQTISSLQIEALLNNPDAVCALFESMLGGYNDFYAGFADATRDEIAYLSSTNCAMFVPSYIVIAEQAIYQGQSEQLEAQVQSIPPDCDNWGAGNLIQDPEEPLPSDSSIETCVDKIVQDLGYKNGIELDKYQIIRDAFTALGLDMRDFFEEGSFNLDQACQILRTINRIGLPSDDAYGDTQTQLLAYLMDICTFDEVRAVATLNAILIGGYDIQTLLNSATVYDLCNLHFPLDPGTPTVTLPERLVGFDCDPDYRYLFLNHYEYLKLHDPELLEQILLGGCLAINEYILTGNCIEYCANNPTVTPTATQTETPTEPITTTVTPAPEIVLTLNEIPRWLSLEEGGTGGGGNIPTAGPCEYLKANGIEEACRGEQAVGVFVQELEARYHLYSLTYTDGVELLLDGANNEEILYPNFSPDANSIAYISVQNGVVKLKWFELTGDVVNEILLPEQIVVAPIVWEDNDSFLATLINFEGEQGIYRLIKNSSRATLELDDAHSPVYFQSTGQEDTLLFAYINADGQLCLYPNRDGSPCDVLNQFASYELGGAPQALADAHCYSQSYSRDGAQFVIDCEVNGVRGIYLGYWANNGYTIQNLNLAPEKIAHFALGPLPNYLAYSQEGGVYFASFATIDEPIRILYSSGNANYLIWRAQP